MDGEKNSRELWDRLENEPERAFRAFETYRNLPSGERTLIAAYRLHVGNPDAAKPSDTWNRWFKEFAWAERARARDAHLDRIRERGMEKAVEEEAKMQARQVEQIHYRYQELMAVGYQRAMEYLESAEFVEHMRPADVVALIKLHFEGVQKLGDPSAQDSDGTVDWSEDEQRELDRIVGEIEAEEAHEEREDDPEEGECSADDEPEG